jgi:hypothetical protein
MIFQISEGRFQNTEGRFQNTEGRFQIGANRNLKSEFCNLKFHGPVCLA